MTGQRKALIIANDKYEHEGLRNLRAPAADAAGPRRVLGDPKIGDFAVQVVRNESAHVIHAEIEELFLDSKPDDVLLLHFSCHGLKSESGELFFAASNTRPDRLGSTATSAEFVQRCMRVTRSRTVVLLLDCCYGGAFTQGVTVRAGEDVNALEKFQQRTGGGRGRVVITASSAMEYSFEGSRLADDRRLRRQPSAFTAALVEGLSSGDADRDQDGWVSLDELYDYVFDKVRERSPHQTPGRHIELAGELYIARSPRMAARQSNPGHARQTAGGPNAVAPPGEAEIVPTADSTAESASAGAAEENSQPEPPDSIKVLPVSLTEWRDRISPEHSLDLGPVAEDVEGRLVRVFWPSLLAAAWFGYAAWIAVSHSSSADLWLGASIGLLSYILGISRAWSADVNNAVIRSLNIVVGCVAFAFYVASMFSGPAHGFFSSAHLIELAWIASVIVLRYIPSSSIRRACRVTYLAPSRKTRERRLRDARAVQGTRWLTGANDREPDFAFLEPLYEMPAARFATLDGQYARLLIVAGREVLLVVSHAWCSIEHQEIAAEIRRWQERLTPVQTKTLVILDREYTTETGIPMPFQVGAEDATYQKEHVSLLTGEMFPAVAGSYLLPGAYELDGDTLHSVFSVLGTTAERVASLRDDAPGPAPSAGSLVQGETGLAEVWAEPEHDQLPVPEIFDSATTDAMRHAESLKEFANALDTRTLLLALAQVHVRGSWDRIWLKCGHSPDDIARQKLLNDPADHPREQWQGMSLTASCANSLRSAARLAARYDMPITPGILALALVMNPRTAAARALGVGDAIDHKELLELIGDELLGFSGMSDWPTS